MAINPKSNLNDLINWLNENLREQNSLKACCLESKNVPQTKGLYFWFMPSSGYKILSKCIPINAISSCYQKNINGEIYDLVYIGSAGVSDNKNGINNGHLNERMKWHLCDNKSVSSLCSGTMSTYRRTIGGLLSSDLINENAQDKIDHFFCKYFLIYYIEYNGTFLEVKDIVNSDENILIQNIRPIFNIKHNPNAEILTHQTYKIMQRRQSVETSSKLRWCAKKTKLDNPKNALKPKKQNTKSGPALPSNNKEFIEIQFKQDEDIQEVLKNSHFHEGRQYHISIFDSLDPSKTICEFYNSTSIPKRYFGNPDVNINRAIKGQKNTYRYQVVKNKMKEGSGIKEITIRFSCFGNKN